MTLDTEIWAAIFVPIGLLVIFFIYCGACMARASFLPEIRCDNFDEMVKRGRATRAKPVVALVGDSHTHCTYGYDWVTPLTNKYPQFQFLNAGINGERADQVLARLDPIIASDPKLVTIIVGSNDRLSAVSRCSACAYGQCTSPRNLDHFKNDMRTMLRRLMDGTTARIAVFSIPNVEAEPNAVIHKKTRLVNEHLRNLVREFDSPRMVYIPFAEVLECYSIPESQGGAYSERNPPTLLWTPGKFIYNTLKVQFLHWVIGYSYEELSRGYGLYTTSDTLHFNAHAGTILSHFVEQFIHDQAQHVLTTDAIPTLAPVSPRPLTLIEVNLRKPPTAQTGGAELELHATQKAFEEAPLNDKARQSKYYAPGSTPPGRTFLREVTESKDGPEIELTELVSPKPNDEQKEDVSCAPVQSEGSVRPVTVYLDAEDKAEHSTSSN